MSTVDPIAVLLADLDRPVSPRPEFEAALRTQLLAELRAPVVAGSTNGASRLTAQRRRWTPRRRRLALALAALVLAVVVVGSALAALGQDPFGGLGSWVGGNPGVPAPTVEARGFQTRNGASVCVVPEAHEAAAPAAQDTWGEAVQPAWLPGRRGLLPAARADASAVIAGRQPVRPVAGAQEFRGARARGVDSSFRRRKGGGGCGLRLRRRHRSGGRDPARPRRSPGSSGGE